MNQRVKFQNQHPLSFTKFLMSTIQAMVPRMALSKNLVYCSINPMVLYAQGLQSAAPSLTMQFCGTVRKVHCRTRYEQQSKRESHNIINVCFLCKHFFILLRENPTKQTNNLPPSKKNPSSGSFEGFKYDVERTQGSISLHGTEAMCYFML